MKIEFHNYMGSAAASAAVRRALAWNPNVVASTYLSQPSLQEANDEGVAGCARGGRAPQFQIG